MRVSSEANQRVGPLSGLAALAEEFGVDMAPTLAELGLRAEDLSPSSPIAFRTARELLNRAIDQTGCAHLGLLLGARYDHTALGLPGQLMATAPTLGDALLDFTGIQIVNSRGAVAYLHRYGDDFALGYGIYEHASQANLVIYDIALAVGVKYVRSLTADRAQPEIVHIARRPPEGAEVYARILGAPVAFNQDQNCIILSRAAMDAGIPGSDPVRRRQLLDALRVHQKHAPAGAKERARHVLRAQILRGHPSLNSVGAELGLHPRTLGRQLAAEGTGFEPICDELRYGVARELLDLTTLPVGAIADSLSFGSQSAFTHAFRRWSGMSPSNWRKRPSDRGPGEADPPAAG